MDILWNYVLPFLVILGILVFVHEWGHYIVARWNGVKVEVFSIGFGRELFGWNDKNGTRWKISLLPLGGYVKMYGDAGVASTPDGKVREMTPEEQAVSFHHKTVGQRAAIVFAGPFINFLFAILVLGTLYATAGQQYTPAVVGRVGEDSAAAKAGVKSGDLILQLNGERIDRFEEVVQIAALRPGQRMPIQVLRNGRKIELVVTPTPRLPPGRVAGQEIGTLGILYDIAPVIGRVMDNSAAAQAGLKPGDRFVSIAGKPVRTFEDLRRAVVPNAGKTLAMKVNRDGRIISLNVTPRPHEIKGKDGRVLKTVGLVGVQPKITERPKRVFDPATAAWKAVAETYNLTVTTGVAIGQMVAGDRSTRDLGGPLRIAEMSGDMAGIGWYTFIWFLGALSLHLCLINLLPVPLLDGGHLLFYGIEALRGKPLGEKAQEYGFRIGLALVLTLMIFATWNDLLHFRIFDFLKS